LSSVRLVQTPTKVIVVTSTARRRCADIRMWDEDTHDVRRAIRDGAGFTKRKESRCCLHKLTLLSVYNVSVIRERRVYSEIIDLKCCFNLHIIREQLSDIDMAGWQLAQLRQLKKKQRSDIIIINILTLCEARVGLMVTT